MITISDHNIGVKAAAKGGPDPVAMRLSRGLADDQCLVLMSRPRDLIQFLSGGFCRPKGRIGTEPGLWSRNFQSRPGTPRPASKRRAPTPGQPTPNMDQLAAQCCAASSRAAVKPISENVSLVVVPRDDCAVTTA